MLEDEDPVLASARRVAEDAEQVARARANGFEGREMQRLKDRLWAYGVTAQQLDAGRVDCQEGAGVRVAAGIVLAGGRPPAVA
ncbi:hypothetical protein [Streptomyces sp. 5-10]|uniref:hypothetical protein n=1 Tax=Streptomyces sp. 5-10 TaxID=878925 RepID=UPI00168B3298|nr:hypothetical protein [Streptomyces sp. 5-10]MBD3008256.1 hypothetical protein [Streptomyces sp. 5-10]